MVEETLVDILFLLLDIYKIKKIKRKKRSGLGLWVVVGT